MIDFLKENVMPLPKAAHHVPKVRQGRKVHVGTIRRWHDPGIQGVSLEVIRIGGTLCTSEEALHRFFQRLTETNSGNAIERTQANEVNHESVEEKLDEFGLS